MPPLPRNYQPVPAALPARYVPSYGTLGEYLGLKGRNTAQGWAQLASVFNNFVETKRAEQMAASQRADVLAQRQAAEQLKRDELAQRAAERAEAQQMRQEALTEKAQLAGERRGDARAKAIGYGPLAETDVDTLMQSPERAGDVRYSFGPGTAEGPELQPTADQRKMIDLEAAVKAQGGLVTPGGGVHMPPKPPTMRIQPAMVGGKRTFVRVDDQGNMLDMGGRPVQAEPIPPRPPSSMSMGGAGDVALSPEAIEEAAHRVRLFGPSSIPTRFNEDDKKRILNRSAAINHSIGQTPAAAAMRAAVQKADQGALTQITKLAASAEAFENKALQQAELVKELSNKVSRSSVPIINGVLVSGQAALGNTPAHLLANALLTYTSEYAKIIEGSTGSAAGSSDAARRAAASLVSTALSKGTLAATIDQMNREMGMTRTGYRTTIDDIANRMGGLPSRTPDVDEEWGFDATGKLVKKPKGPS